MSDDLGPTCEERIQAAYESGYSDGHDEGREQGYDEGYDEGLLTCHERG